MPFLNFAWSVAAASFIGDDHVVAHDIMAHEVDMVDRYIVAEITADDNAVVESNGQAEDC